MGFAVGPATALVKVVEAVRRISGKRIKHPDIVYDCPEVIAEHKESSRQFAHVRHFRNTICLHHAFNILPDGHKLGILAHELGHLQTSGGGEAEADLWVQEVMGIDIQYRNSLQWISSRNPAFKK